MTAHFSGRAPSAELCGAILDSVSDGVFSIDGEWRIQSFNRAAEAILGVPAERALQRPCREVMRADVCGSKCPLRYTLETGNKVVNYPIHVTRADGQHVPVSISTAALCDDAGKTIGGVETFRDLSVIRDLRRQLRPHHSFHNMISANPRMLQIFEILPRVAESECTVLIEGESGTGKELLARALHRLSPRHNTPMTCINCGAIPESLLESELFGYRAGAFTGAHRDKPGKLEAAHSGTVFFDEVGETPEAIQVKLLRVFEQGELERLGDLRPTEVDLRIVAATNHDLAVDVEQGRFRTDLYFRLNVMRFELPPLRERIEDVPLLVEHFLRRFSSRLGRDIRELSGDAMAALMQHAFPGNVRELQHIVERACVLCRGERIELEHLPQRLQTPLSREVAIHTRLDSHESAIIRQALERNGWNRSAAARELGIHRSTLFKKIKRLNVKLPARDGRSKLSHSGNDAGHSV